MTLNFNNAKPEDAQLVTDILNQAAEFKRQHGDKGWGVFNSQGISKMLATGETYIVSQGKQPVATLSLESKDSAWDEFDPSALYVHRLAVKHSAHGQDLGKKMIIWAEEQAKRNDIKYLRLDCSTDNSALCNYYEKQGFTKVAQKYFEDFNYTANLYQKTIL